MREGGEGEGDECRGEGVEWGYLTFDLLMYVLVYSADCGPVEALDAADRARHRTAVAQACFDSRHGARTSRGARALGIRCSISVATPQAAFADHRLLPDRPKYQQ